MRVKRHKHRRMSLIEQMMFPMIRVAVTARHTPHRLIIRKAVSEATGREYMLHATKGYRSSKA